MYVANKAATKPEVAAFLDYVVENQQTIADTALIVGLTDEQATKATDTVAQATGS